MHAEYICLLHSQIYKHNFDLLQSKEVQKESSSQATEKVVAEKPPTAQCKKRVFTRQEGKDTGKEEVIQTKVSKQPKTCITLLFLFFFIKM